MATDAQSGGPGRRRHGGYWIPYADESNRSPYKPGPRDRILSRLPRRYHRAPQLKLPKYKTLPLHGTGHRTSRGTLRKQRI